MKKKLLTAIAVFQSLITISQTVEWSEYVYGAGDEYGYGIGADSEGRVYVAGSFQGEANFWGAPHILNSSGGNDIFIAKYFHKGQTIWEKRAGGAGDDRAAGLITDGDGNSYITGYFNGTADFSGTSLVSAGGSDIFIAKYDSSGILKWAKRMGSPADDAGTGITMNKMGTIAISAYIGGNADVLGTTVNTNGVKDIFIAGVNSDGALSFATAIGGTGDDQAFAIATDQQDFFMTGSFLGAVVFGTSTLTSSTYKDVFTTKINTSGTVQWAKKGGGAQVDIGYGITCDGTGNVIITGLFNTTCPFGSTSLSTSGGEDIFIVKYNTSGTQLWAKKAGGSATAAGVTDVGFAITADEFDNIYVGGYFTNTATFGTTSVTGTNATFTDLFIAKYLPDGTTAWVKADGGTGSDQILDLYLHSNGKLYFTGNYYEAMDLTGSYNMLGTNYEIFIADIQAISVSAKEINGAGDLSVYPNPFSGILNIHSEGAKIEQVTVSNITGARVEYRSDINQLDEQIDLSHLSKGVYFISIKTNENVVVRKLIKN